MKDKIDDITSHFENVILTAKDIIANEDNQTELNDLIISIEKDEKLLYKSESLYTSLENQIEIDKRMLDETNIDKTYLTLSNESLEQISLFLDVEVAKISLEDGSDMKTALMISIEEKNGLLKIISNKIKGLISGIWRKVQKVILRIKTFILTKEKVVIDLKNRINDLPPKKYKPYTPSEAQLKTLTDKFGFIGSLLTNRENMNFGIAAISFLTTFYSKIKPLSGLKATDPTTKLYDQIFNIRAEFPFALSDLTGKRFKLSTKIKGIDTLRDLYQNKGIYDFTIISTSGRDADCLVRYAESEKGVGTYGFKLIKLSLDKTDTVKKIGMLMTPGLVNKVIDEVLLVIKNSSKVINYLDSDIKVISKLVDDFGKIDPATVVDNKGNNFYASKKSFVTGVAKIFPKVNYTFISGYAGFVANAVAVINMNVVILESFESE